MPVLLFLSLYLASLAIPTLIGSIVPAAGNAAGAGIGQVLNWLTTLALTAMRGLVTVWEMVTHFEGIISLLRRKVDEAVDDGQDEDELEVPDIEFSETEIDELATHTFPVIQEGFGLLVQVALAALGTAFGNLGKKIRTKVFGGKRHRKKDVDKELNKRLCTRFCFPAGTLVDTADGLRPIESVQEGELVWGRDEKSGHWDLHQVVETYQREYTGPVVTLQAGEEMIVVTGGHPFWVELGDYLGERREVVGLRNDPEAGGVRGRWVSAKDLRVGDRLVSRKGKPVTVESLLVDDQKLAVYNFHVGAVHSYSITEPGIWVHNESKDCKSKKKDSDRPRKGTPRYKQLINKEKRIRNELAAGGNRGISGRVNRGEADFVGERFVGEGFTERAGPKGERILISKDGLRQYRSPTAKDNPFSETGVQANFQNRPAPGGTWPNNVHIDVE